MSNLLAVIGVCFVVCVVAACVWFVIKESK